MKNYALKLILSMVVTCFYQVLLSQPPFLLPGANTMNFFTLQSLTNEYYKQNPKESGYKQWKRAEWYIQSRLGQGGQQINTLAQNATAWWNYMKNNNASRSTNGSWLFLGPNSVTDILPGSAGSGLGRLNTVKIDPTNENILYVGAASGGIWKSTTGGTSWINISPYLPSLSIKDIVIDPDNPSKIFVLTGDGYNQQHSSIGILKTLDGGETWLPTNAPVFPGATYKLLMHSDSAEIQYAATDDGLYKTTDEWNSWTQIYDSYVYDVELKPGNPSTIYISTQIGFLKKVNTGEWIYIQDIDFSSWPGWVYTQIAVTPDNPECIYGFVSSSGDPIGLYRSLSSGDSQTWTVQDNAIPNLGGQGSYNRSLEVHTENYELITLGQVWTVSSASGGVPGSWYGPNNYVHADVHRSLLANEKLYHANDGGLFESTDSGTVFTDLSAGLAIMEIYGIGGTPQDLNLIFCGTQDNGTNRHTSGTDFDHVLGNDGGNCLVKYSNQDIVYAMYQEGTLSKSIDGGNTFTLINPPGIGAWVSPVLMDPIIPEIIFIGKDSLFRSLTEGSSGSWINLGKPYAQGGKLMSLAQGTSDRERIYAANSRFTDFKIFKADNAVSSSGNLSWINITSGLPDGTVTGITVNPDNAQEVYVSFGNLIDGAKVYRSLSGGASGTWVNISGSLPNVSMNCIDFHDNGLNNNAIYVGTDIGVFYRNDDLGDWIYFSNNLPVVNVTDLYINTAANLISAGTYGRGLWISATYDDCDPAISLVNPSSGDPVGGVRYYSASNTIESITTYRTDLGTEAHYTSGNYIDMNPGFKIGGFAFFEAKIGPCPGSYSPPGFQTPPQVSNFDFETWLNMGVDK